MLNSMSHSASNNSHNHTHNNTTSVSDDSNDSDDNEQPLSRRSVKHKYVPAWHYINTTVEHQTFTEL